jgi:predicted ATPase with chaperone activity
VNAHVPASAIQRLLPLASDARAAWHELVETRVLTGRGAARVQRVARTLADLDDRAEIAATDVELASSFRGDLP